MSKSILAIAAALVVTACGGGNDPLHEVAQAVPGSNQCIIDAFTYRYLITSGALPPRPTESTSILSRYDWKPPYLVLKPEFRQPLITLATIPALGPYHDPAETEPPPYVCR